jgi:hypothetical protein
MQTTARAVKLCCWQRALTDQWSLAQPGQCTVCQVSSRVQPKYTLTANRAAVQRLPGHEAVHICGCDGDKCDLRRFLRAESQIEYRCSNDFRW